MSNKLKKCVVLSLLLILMFNINSFADEYVAHNLYSEDFTNTSLEEYFAYHHLMSMTNKISGLKVSDISYDRLCDFLTDIDLSAYDSYLIQGNSSFMQLIYFTCSGDLVYSWNGSDVYCRFLYKYHGSVEKVRIINITPKNGILTSDSFNIGDDMDIDLSGKKVGEYYYYSVSAKNLISTNCNVYDTVELLDTYEKNTACYFDVNALNGTNLNKYSAYEQSDTIKNHTYLTSCDIGFMTTDSTLSGSQKSRFNQSNLYIDYGIDKFMSQNINQYNLNVTYSLNCDGIMYNKGDTFTLNSNKYNVIGASIFGNGVPDGQTRTTFTRFIYENIDFKKLAVGNSKFGNGISVIPYLNQDITLTEQGEIGTDYTPINIYNLTVSVQVVSKDGKYKSGVYKKTFDLLQGSANVVTDDITINNNPYQGGGDSSNDMGNSGYGSGGSSATNNSSITNSPTFTNNNTITIEGDSINNGVIDIVDSSTAKDSNTSFIDKFLGFFDLLKNNKFVTVLSLVFGWLPAEVFTLLVSAIGITVGIALFRFFRK